MPKSEPKKVADIQRFDQCASLAVAWKTVAHVLGMANRQYFLECGRNTHNTNLLPWCVSRSYFTMFKLQLLLLFSDSLFFSACFGFNICLSFELSVCVRVCVLVLINLFYEYFIVVGLVSVAPKTQPLHFQHEMTHKLLQAIRNN